MSRLSFGGLKMKFIKKIMIGILVLSIVVVISACSQSDEDKTGTTRTIGQRAVGELSSQGTHCH